MTKITAGAFSIQTGATIIVELDSVIREDDEEIQIDDSYIVKATDAYQMSYDDVARRCFMVISSKSGEEPLFPYLWLADDDTGPTLANNFFKLAGKERTE